MKSVSSFFYSVTQVNSSFNVSENVSSSLKTLNERERRVYEAMQGQCMNLACEALTEQMEENFGCSLTQIYMNLDRIQSLYNQMFPPTPDLNASLIKCPTFLVDAQDIQQAFNKADRLFIAYQNSCINEIIPEIPKYIHSKLNLEPEDLSTVEKLLNTVQKEMREELDGEFITFHDLSAQSYIHYFLRIPPRVPNSESSWILRNLKNLTNSC